MKTKNIFTALFAVSVFLLLIGIIGCEDGVQGPSSNQMPEYSYGVTANIASTPESNGGIIPYIIPGSNPGGNRTCAEVSLAFGGCEYPVD
jgi:hypothetical protein